jgi:hypothetical protein
MQESQPWFLLPAILVGFPMVFVAMWSLVCVIIAGVAGWGAMATRYAAPPGFRGTPLPSGHANRVGLASYKSVLSFEAAPEGLVVRVMRIFPFHPTLLLPWRALTLTRGGSGFFSAGTMKVEGGTDFSLNSDAFQSIERAIGTAASMPTARM